MKKRSTVGFELCNCVLVLVMSALAVGCEADSARPDAAEGVEPGSCTDGADNDGDGDFDCADSGCLGAPACSRVDGGGFDAGTRDSGGMDIDNVDAGECPCNISANCDCMCDPDCAAPDLLCEESCEYSMDGECDDGGPGSLFSVCALGTDCTDCGPRDPDVVCMDTCDVNECGDGGCGRSCGSCELGESCMAGQCETTGCVPDCSGRVCGDDPRCGTSCGTCEAGNICNRGVCEPDVCIPDCSGRECGSDGCRGSCAPGCASGETCSTGTCERDCFSSRIGVRIEQNGDWSDVNYCEARITQTDESGSPRTLTARLMRSTTNDMVSFANSCDYNVDIEVVCSMRGESCARRRAVGLGFAIWISRIQWCGQFALPSNQVTAVASLSSTSLGAAEFVGVGLQVDFFCSEFIPARASMDQRSKTALAQVRKSNSNPIGSRASQGDFSRPSRLKEVA